MFHFKCHSWMFRDSETVLQTMSPKTRIEQIEFYEYLRRSAANAQWLPAEIFVSKTTPFKVLSKRTNKFSKVRLLPKKYPGKRNIVSDCKSIGRKEPSLNILFLAKNIVDPCEIYMDGICKWSLTAGLRFIGYVGIGKCLPFFKNQHFLIFTAKNAPLKQTHPMINFSCFGENKLCQLIRPMIGFILTKFQNFDFWVDFQLCSILTGSNS